VRWIRYDTQSSHRRARRLALYYCSWNRTGHIFSDDKDRDNFVERLGDIVTGTQSGCIAWALIPNHILLRTGQAPLATAMRRLLTGYAVAYNRRHRRHGHLFQNRYK
jgi:hypothetical protein